MNLQLYQILLKQERFDSLKKTVTLLWIPFVQYVDPIRFFKQESASRMMFDTTELLSGVVQS